MWNVEKNPNILSIPSYFNKLVWNTSSGNGKVDENFNFSIIKVERVGSIYYNKNYQLKGSRRRTSED